MFLEPRKNGYKNDDKTNNNGDASIIIIFLLKSIIDIRFELFRKCNLYIVETEKPKLKNYVLQLMII